ncbi:uncharacterized protein LOC136025286 [Artemia franciscana]|uniref:Uncharacterized protein n=1 Tax=Artemia franciscana TaxID=6661 RepID=A0AA88HP16_ARTSF|nr:hypothetical protein QYM36_011234 [Artemia franciscana]
MIGLLFYYLFSYIGPYIFSSPLFECYNAVGRQSRNTTANKPIFSRLFKPIFSRRRGRSVDGNSRKIFEDLMLALNSEENEVTKDIEMAVTELPEFATTLGNETNYVNASNSLNTTQNPEKKSPPEVNNIPNIPELNLPRFVEIFSNDRILEYQEYLEHFGTILFLTAQQIDSTNQTNRFSLWQYYKGAGYGLMFYTKCLHLIFGGAALFAALLGNVSC